MASEQVTSPAPSPSPAAHIIELDGVRAIAVWLVILDHIIDGWPVSAAVLQMIPLPIRLLSRYGWLGVDLFFVLSGFLITGILLRSRGKPHYFRNFYARRTFRIIPIYFLVIFVCWFFYGSAYNSYFLASLFFLANFYHALGLQPPHGPSVFWSLAIEEHFYLFWPLLVRFLQRSWLTKAAFALCIGIPALRFYAKSQGLDINSEIYPITWFRLDGLATGALLAIWSQSRYATQRNTLRLGGLLLVLFVVETVGLIPLGILQSGSVFRYNQAQVFFAGFVAIVLGLRGTAWTALLRTGFFRLTGDVSYCLYLIHLSVGDAYQAIVRWSGWQLELRIGELGAFGLRTVFLVVVSFALAMLSRRYIEQPVLRLKRHFE
ncbi:MAG: acyltransferase [Acidobacteriota bacterium]